MAREINPLYGTSTAMTITLASLATSTAGVGRQSTMVSNESTRYDKVHIYAKVTTGTSPTASKTITMYLLQGDDASSSNWRTDGAGASDAGLTVVNAKILDVVQTSSTSNTTYYLEGIIYNPGKEFGVAIVHNTGVNLNATGGNHEIRYVGENPQIA